MIVIPVRTRRLHPPQDDLHEVLFDALPPLQERDVVCVSSKVVAIHEGRCVPIGVVDKSVLITTEADVCIQPPYRGTPITITHHTFLGAAGIDESNSAGHYVLLPRDVFMAASDLYTLLRDHFGLSELGVVITDSRSQPFRYGAFGVALGWWGIEPLIDHTGAKDLFGRSMQYERSNIVDAIAASATLVMGEVAECQPVAIVREVAQLTYTMRDTRQDILVPPQEDIFRCLYEQYLR